jgi:hypothetical protein
MTAVTESELAAKASAPRVTEPGLGALIASEHYFTAADGVFGSPYGALPDGYDPLRHPLALLTFCVLVLKNGFTVTGQSACASPENFNEDIGRRLAFTDAKNKIWQLEGYLLRQRLHEKEQA